MHHYIIGPGMRHGRIEKKSEMHCEKNMPAVKWMGPCPLYEREPGAD